MQVKNRKFSAFAWLLFFLLFIILLILIGFIFFIYHIVHLTPPNRVLPKDAIVVFTGGRSRLEVGINLVKTEAGNRLLISGVNKTVGYQSVLKHKQSAKIEKQVDLGYNAKNTIGNVKELSLWAKQHNYHSLYLVTNNYHMPRSLLWLKATISDIEIIPYPVRGDYPSLLSAHKYSSIYLDFTWLKIVFIEYLKFIGTYLWLSSFGGKLI